MVVARRILSIMERTFYKRYYILSFSPYIVIVFYKPVELDSEIDPKIDGILNILKTEIENLKSKRSKKNLYPFNKQRALTFIKIETTTVQSFLNF